ncbi:MAG: hypothetical protein JXA67_00075 [Micromonosporaceae bacterium]|nr:hypothetical protein [Micromonosporaceae bacterium]
MSRTPEEIHREVMGVRMFGADGAEVPGVLGRLAGLWEELADAAAFAPLAVAPLWASHAAHLAMFYVNKLADERPAPTGATGQDQEVTS